MVPRPGVPLLYVFRTNLHGQTRKEGLRKKQWQRRRGPGHRRYRSRLLHLAVLGQESWARLRRQSGRWYRRSSFVWPLHCSLRHRELGASALPQISSNSDSRTSIPLTPSSSRPNGSSNRTGDGWRGLLSGSSVMTSSSACRNWLTLSRVTTPVRRILRAPQTGRTMTRHSWQYSMR